MKRNDSIMLTKEQLLDELVYKTTRQIAEEHGVTQTVVSRKWCKQYNINKQMIYAHRLVTKMKDINPTIEVVGEYKGAREFIDVRCKTCNYEWSPLADSLLHGHGCMRCTRGWYQTNEEFQSKVDKVHNGNIQVSGFVKYDRTVDAKCLVCEHEWSPMPNNLLDGHGCKECYFKSVRGSNHHFWNPDLTDEDRLYMRREEGYTTWVRDVYKKDSYTCQCCGYRKGELNAHHLYNYTDHPELRTDVNNGVTLCVPCHTKFHNRYGKRNNTPEQFYEFKEMKLYE
jgi:hypothetical protein